MEERFSGYTIPLQPGPRSRVDGKEIGAFSASADRVFLS
jgi:hypothetical protein